MDSESYRELSTRLDELENNLYSRISDLEFETIQGIVDSFENSLLKLTTRVTELSHKVKDIDRPIWTRHNG